MERRYFLKTVGASTVAGVSIAGGSSTVAAEETGERYVREFGSDALGSSPSDFEDVYEDVGQGLEREVVKRFRRGPVGSEQCLRVRKDGTGKDGVVWTDIPDAEDVELFCVWRNESGSEWTNRLNLLARASNDGTGVLGGSPQFDLARIIQYDPGFSELGVDEREDITLGREIAQRFRVVGDQAWVRVWPWGSREPREWTLGPVSVDLALAGGIGVFTWGSGNAETDIVIWQLGAVVDPGPDESAPQRDPDLDFMSFPEEITHPLQADERDIWYPDGWDENRDGGARVHRAVDLYEGWKDDGIVKELPPCPDPDSRRGRSRRRSRDEGEEGRPVPGAPVFAARGGTIRDWMPEHPASDAKMTPGSGGGYQIHVDSHDGNYMYGYLHFGIDEPELHEYAYAPHPEEDRTLGPGDTVERGQHIGWVGTSGDTDSGPHLHFEIRDNAGLLEDDQPSDFDSVGFSDGPRYDPYPVLRDAERRGDYPTASYTSAPFIRPGR